MKVTIATGIYPPSIGGPATYSKLLFEHLPKVGIDVEVVSFDAVRHLPKGIRHIVYIWKLWRAARTSDLLFAQDPVSVGLPTYIVSRLLYKKYLLKVVGDYAWEQAQQRAGVTDLLDVFVTKKTYPRFVRVLKKVQTFVAKHAEQICVPSQYLKKIVQAWGIDEKKIEVIYNGFSAAVVDETKALLRQQLRMEGKVIVSIGRLVPWKGFATLISLMPQLIMTYPDIHLYIIGSGPDEARLRKCINKEHLTSRVTLVGGVSKNTVLHYLKAADMFVLNTAYEGFSHQLLEAMSIGTPIITTSVGGNPELIEHKKEGLLVTYDAKDELLHAIEHLMKDATTAEMYAQKAQVRVRDFSTDIMLTKLTQWIKKIS